MNEPTVYDVTDCVEIVKCSRREERRKEGERSVETVGEDVGEDVGAGTDSNGRSLRCEMGLLRKTVLL